MTDVTEFIESLESIRNEQDPTEKWEGVCHLRQTLDAMVGELKRVRFTMINYVRKQIHALEDDDIRLILEVDAVVSLRTRQRQLRLKKAREELKQAEEALAKPGDDPQVVA